MAENGTSIKTAVGWRDLVYVVVLAIGMATTWGKMSAEVNHLEKEIIELKVMEEKQHNLEVEFAGFRSDVEHIKWRVDEILGKIDALYGTDNTR